MIKNASVKPFSGGGFTLIIKDHVRVTFKSKWRSEQSNTYCGRIRDITGLPQRTEGSLYLINLFLHVC